jgi:5S rRNA maturation endonuclease (ribonuclease M5)
MIKILVDLDTEGESFNKNIRGEVAKLSRDINEMILEAIGTESTCITRVVFCSNNQKIGVITITNPWKE